jgi:hypothetical protein
MIVWFLNLLITQPSPSPAPAGVVTVDLADVDAVWVPPGHAGPVVATHGPPGVRGL